MLSALIPCLTGDLATFSWSGLEYENILQYTLAISGKKKETSKERGTE
jgi:hypothetical protein